MSMLSSCTFVSRAPLPLPSRAAQPSVTVSLPRPRVPADPVSRWQSSSRAPLFVCRSQNEDAYSIHHKALVNRWSTISGHDWSIMEDNDHINLLFKVGESTSTKTLLIQFTADQQLQIKDNSPGSKLDVHLQMPSGYDYNNDTIKMQAAILPSQWLQVTIAKPKLKPVTVPVTPPATAGSSPGSS